MNASVASKRGDEVAKNHRFQNESDEIPGRKVEKDKRWLNSSH